jgi:hypothetical protein
MAVDMLVAACGDLADTKYLVSSDSDYSESSAERQKRYLC